MKSKDKLLRLLREIQTLYYDLEEFLKERNSEQEIKISRWRLRGFIANTLDLTERHSIYLWIERLLAMNVLKLNPTSSFNKDKKYMPNNNTKYFIDIDAINEILEKPTYHTHQS